ncbi:MAG: hypothetical protein GIX02_12155 [Candidatus Eremiobacteraeota bacterium]|nr:hypothetical protein [Candidatus Eremiobacteraeota bacterium]
MSPTAASALVVEHSEDAARTMADGIGHALAGVCAVPATPADAVELARKCRPDVITVSLALARGGGLRIIKELLRNRKVPIIAVSSLQLGGSDSLPFRALKAGACDLMIRPSSGGVAAEKHFLSTLADRVKALAAACGDGFQPHVPRAGKAASDSKNGRVECIVVGASTGGPLALVQLLRGMGTNFPTPVVVVQHIATPFVDGLVRWLDDETPLHVSVAEDGLAPQKDHAYIAPGGSDLVFDAGGCLRLQPPTTAGRIIVPSADALFESAAHRFHDRCAGVILTGMGRDGAAGLLKMRSRGAKTFGQEKASCTVFGMPEAADSLGAVGEFADPEDIGRQLRTLTEG